MTDPNCSAAARCQFSEASSDHLVSLSVLSDISFSLMESRTSILIVEVKLVVSFPASCCHP